MNKLRKSAAVLSAVCLTSGIYADSRIIKNDQKQLFVDDQIRFASGLVERHYYSAAVDEFQRLIKRFPNDPVVAEAYLRLGETYADQKEFNKAIAAFEKFFKKFPEIKIFKSAQLRYAIVLFKSPDQNSKSKAIRILTSLINDKSTPQIVKDASVYHLGKKLVAFGKKKEAVKILTLTAYQKAKSETDKFKAFAALELADLLPPTEGEKLLHPLSESVSLPSYILTPVTWKLAEIYRKKNQYRKASELYAKSSVLFTAPDARKEAYYKRLECLFLAGDYSSVISEANKILSDKKSSDNELNHRILYVKALALVKKNFRKQAIGILQDVFSNTVDSDLKGKSLYSLIESLSILKKQQPAARMLKNLINNNSLSGDIIAEPLIFLIKNSHDSPEYLSILDSLIQKKGLSDKNLNKLLLKKADILENNGRLAEAEKTVQKVLSSQEKSLTPFALYKSASILAQTDQKEKAIDSYRTILKKYNKSAIYPAALLKTGILLLEDKKNRAESIMYFNQLISKFKGTSESDTAAFYMAYIDFMDKNYSKAQKQFQSLLAELSDKDGNSLSANTKIYLIWTYIKQKKTQEALEIVKKSPEKLFSIAPESFLENFAEYFKETESALAETALIFLLKADNPVIRQRALIKLSELQIPGREKKAELNIKKALELNADKRLTQIARFKLAELLMNTGKKEEAVLLFEKCLENPIDKNIAAKARLGLAEILASDEERLQTANRYAMSVFILSKEPETASKAMLLSIKLSIKLKNKTEAESTLKELLSRFPETAESPAVRELKREIDKLPDNKTSD